MDISLVILTIFVCIEASKDIIYSKEMKQYGNFDPSDGAGRLKYAATQAYNAAKKRDDGIEILEYFKRQKDEAERIYNARMEQSKSQKDD